MKLVTTELGQVLQLFVADELRPLRGLDVPNFLQLVTQKYRFAKVPANLLSNTETQGSKFENGIIALPSGNIPILKFEIYGDGIIIDVRHTDDADAVMRPASQAPAAIATASPSLAAPT